MFSKSWEVPTEPRRRWTLCIAAALGSLGCSMVEWENMGKVAREEVWGEKGNKEEKNRETKDVKSGERSEVINIIRAEANLIMPSPALTPFSQTSEPLRPCTAQRRSKTGGRRVTLQRQPNRLPRSLPFCLVNISPSPSAFITKIRLRESA